MCPSGQVTLTREGSGLRWCPTNGRSFVRHTASGRVGRRCASLRPPLRSPLGKALQPARPRKDATLVRAKIKSFARFAEPKDFKGLHCAEYTCGKPLGSMVSDGV